MTPLAVEMTALYREVVAGIVDDDATAFHVLPIPDFEGDSFISSKGIDPDLDMAAEAICGIPMNDTDCVVVLGKGVLEEHRNEEEMVEIVIDHIEQHINSVWEVGDPNMGWVNRPITSALISSLLTCAHPVLSLIDYDDEMVIKVKDKAITSVTQHRFHANPQTKAAIERICEEAAGTNGGYLALPVRVSDLVSASQEIFCDVVDRMETRPMGTV